MDGTVKVFPFMDSLHTKPVTTLHTSSPVTTIRWRGSQQPTELAVVPLSTNPGATSSVVEGHDAAMSRLNNELEIWDLRRPYVPKSVLRTGLGGITGVVCPHVPSNAPANVDLLWAVHKDAGVLAQHDVHHDAQRPFENLPKANLSWAPGGQMAFVSPLDDADTESALEMYVDSPLLLSAMVLMDSVIFVGTTFSHLFRQEQCFPWDPMTRQTQIH